jgi:VWFA-related protein
MNTLSFLRRGLPRPARLSSRIALLLMLTTVVARPGAAASEKPLAADAAPATLTQLPPLKQPDTARPPLALHTQPVDVNFAPGTQLVTVRAPLRDPQARWMSNAHPDSFAVYDNGVRQHDVNVAVEHTPISIGILLEYGGRYHTLNEIRGQDVPAAAEELLDQTGPDDKVAVWKYADRVDAVTRRAGISDSVQHTLGLPTPAFSELNFYDAIIATLPKMRAMSGRKALVLMSSGLDTFSRASFADVLTEARSAGVPIYVINLGPIIRSALPPSASETGLYASLNWSRAEAQLEKLARASGGRMYSPESRLDLPCVYDELMATLRVQYVIQYKSPASANLERRPRTVRVEWADAGAEGSATTVDSARSERTGLIAEAEYMPAVKSETHNNVSATISEAMPTRSSKS